MSKLNSEIEAFLKEPRFAVLATINEDGTPHQTIVWYDLRGDTIMMNTRVGRIKEKNLARDPRLSICIEDEYDWLTLSGRATLDYDHERSQDDIRDLAIRYYGPERGNEVSERRFRKQKRVTIYMTVEHVMGE